MTQFNDAISVRSTRLNNVLLGGGGGGRNYGVSVGFSETITREALFDAFCTLYNECSKDALRKRDKNISDFVNKFHNIIEEIRRLRVNVNDFNVRALIGRGYFGTVHLVIERHTGDVYAMKKIKKSVVTTSQVKEERDIMSRRSSEWITKLQYSFQDNDYLYLVMEYMPGGDLLSLMSRHGSFDEQWTRFYLAELTEAIHSLHHMGYVHRDIKPENILIDRFGHIRLGDFGNAAALDRDGHVLNLSPVGTPDYIAPELLQTISSYKLNNSMHDVSCDFWSMGIIGYELICGVTPFHDENVHETYTKILSHCEESQLKELISFPSDLNLSQTYTNLIESLVTNPSNRLGYKDIRNHSFFNVIKWDSLRSQLPPIIPNLKSDDDTSNFEDVIPNKTRNAAELNVRKPPQATLIITSNEFSGKDLPFIGYSFVHLERQQVEPGALEDARFVAMNTKFKELQLKYKERVEDISKLNQKLLRAELLAKQSDTQKKILQDAKEELSKMKDAIKEKNTELAKCRTQVKTLQSSLKIEQEMWAKKEATITEVLCMNRQKYEEAKYAAEMRYEKRIAEIKLEMMGTVKKLNKCEDELIAKTEECTQLQEKIDNYKEMLKQQKEQTQEDREEFEKSKAQLTETYEQKLSDLRNRLRQERNTKSRLTMELRDVRTELDDTNNCRRNSEEAKLVIDKANDEILKRLNNEIEINNELNKKNSLLEQKLLEAQRDIENMQQEVQHLERDLQVVECSKKLTDSPIGTAEIARSAALSPYETAPGSLTDIRIIEENLRADLAAAKENENAQKERADKLQEIIIKLEKMLEKYDEHAQSPLKPLPAPRSNCSSTTADELLEKQNERLEDKLATVREKMIIEKQAARTANLALWRLEKQLEETLAAKKDLQNQLDKSEERFKKLTDERDETQRLCLLTEEAKRQREKHIEELKKEIDFLKKDLIREHKMWERAEEERMKIKSEVIEYISNCKRLEERISEYSHKLQQSQERNDKLDAENKRLMADIFKEKDLNSTISDQLLSIQLELKNLQDNYERLKYACSVADTQLTELEALLEKEQAANKMKQQKLDQLQKDMHKMDENENKLRGELDEERREKQNSEARIQVLLEDLSKQKTKIDDLEGKLRMEEQEGADHRASLYDALEKLEIVQNENKTLQTINENCDREIFMLKEENTRILSDLFHAKEETQQLQHNLKDACEQLNEMQDALKNLQNMLDEKENFYIQRDIKAEATLSQHKKLIDYLQLKVEDLTTKKKKTLADKLFGTSSTSHGASTPMSNKKEAAHIESSIIYRTLQEELKREQLRCKSLQEELDKLKKVQTPKTRSPLKSTENSLLNNTENVKDAINSTNVAIHKKSPNKNVTKSPQANRKAAKELNAQSHHRFELALQESAIDINYCMACQKLIMASSPYWKCKECKQVAHRKCRNEAALTACNEEVQDNDENCSAESYTESNANDLDTNSLGKYSYEPKLDTPSDSNSISSFIPLGNIYNGTLVFKAENSLEVSCAVEMEEKKLLLLGCNIGLYAYNIETSQLLRIVGMDAVSCITICRTLNKALLIGCNGNNLYQCDLRHLQSRSQAKVCLKLPLEASILDLSFAKRGSNEKWLMIEISEEIEQPLNAVAIAVTLARIVILKYDINLQKFKAIRALETATPVTSITFTRHTAIVSSDKFFEIDLDTYGAEEFIDISDQSLSHVQTCQPIKALRISKQEILLGFMECGIFVDEYGCRSRPYDINWEYTPTGFIYRAPFLYVTHFQSIQIIRLHRSYSNEVETYTSAAKVPQKGEINSGENAYKLQNLYMTFYMPTFLCNSGKLNLYMLAVRKESGLQEVYHVDALQAFKKLLNESLDTVSSIATSITEDTISEKNK